MPWETDDTVPVDLFIILEAYQNKQVTAWKQTREIVYTLAAVNRDPKKPFPTREKFMPLPGDEEMIQQNHERRKREYQEQRKKIGLK
jgi:hypothetical protein